MAVVFDRTEEFKTIRQSDRRKKEKEIERVDGRTRLLAFTIGSNPKGWMKEVYEDSGPECSSCRQSFRGGKKKKLCAYCKQSFCESCCRNVVKIKPSGISGPAIEVPVDVCNSCFGLYSRAQKQQEWKQKVEKAKEDPLYGYYGIAQEIRDFIINLLPEFKDAVNTIVHSNHLDEALIIRTRNLEKKLGEFFSNWDLSIAKFNGLTLKPDSKGFMLRAHILQYQHQLRETHLSAFKLCANELNLFLREAKAKNLPIVGPSATKQQQPQPIPQQPQQNKTVSTSPPAAPPRNSRIEISTLAPALLPLAGGEIFINGENFDDRMDVRIDGISCKYVLVNSGAIAVNAPKCSSAGWKMVELIPYDHKVPPTRISDVLYYDDQPFDYKPAAKPTLSKYEQDVKNSRYTPAPATRSDSKLSKGGSTASIIPTSSSAPAGLNHNLMITKVEPIVCPMTGSTVKLYGVGLTPKTIVQVDGIPMKCQLNEEGALVFQSPPFSTEGFKRIAISDPQTNSKFALDDVLLYTQIQHEPSQEPSRSVTKVSSGSRVWGTR